MPLSSNQDVFGVPGEGMGWGRIHTYCNTIRKIDNLFKEDIFSQNCEGIPSPAPFASIFL
jgi:hypothetical protein